MRVAITDFVAVYPENQRFRLEKPAQHFWIERQSPPLWGLSDAVRLSDELSLPNEPGEIAVSVGTSKGDLTALSHWPETQNFEWMPGALAARLARKYRASGPVFSPNAACATGVHALALGARLVQSNRAQTVIAGAMEFPQPELILAAYRNMGALSKSGIMRPFDARRDGFVPASGGALFVLEPEARARSRGAQIHGFLTGVSLHCDAHHMTSMNASGEGIARAIRGALAMTNHPKIDYINAHGTATINDAIESRAIASVFGDKVPISSTKARTGHLLGAAGAVEAAICLLAMRDDFAPPTLNLEQIDGELVYVPLVGRSIEINKVLSLNYGFGGHIGALVLEKF